MAHTVEDVKVHFIAHDHAVRGALEDLLSGLRPLALSVEEAGTVELVVAEALNNIVEHAYAGATQPGPVDIFCTGKTDGLHIRIVDEGAPMPEGRTPLGEAPAVNVDIMDLPEGGFGWFLIGDLAKDVVYERINHQNVLTLRLAVAIQKSANP